MTAGDRGGKRGERGAGTPWRPPTRRAFFAMLGGAAATVAVRSGPGLLSERAHDDDRPRRTWRGTTRWIGHC